MLISFISKTTLRFSKDNSIFQEMLKTFGVIDDEISKIDSFEVTIRPKKNQDIGESVKRIASNTEDDGLERFVMRAKEELKDSLTDYYLIGQGQVYDMITARDETGIVEQMQQKIKDNEQLGKQATEFQNNENFERNEPEAFSVLHDVAAWPGGVAAV